MKKIILAFCIAIFFGACSSSETKKTFYENGALKSEVPVSNGRESGLMREYFEDGSLAAEIEMKDNVRNGKSISYYPSGEIARRRRYSSGKEIGADDIYYPNGQLKISQIFDSLGLKVDFAAFKENGEIDYDRMEPITIEKQGSLLLRLANADPSVYKQGRLIVTTRFDKEGVPVDTLYTTISTNIEGFEYAYKDYPHDTLRAVLVFQIPRDTVTAIRQIFALQYIPKLR